MSTPPRRANDPGLEEVQVRGRRLRGISRNVLMLGLVSFVADVSSEMAYPIVPVFLTMTLGASVPVVGVIEGIAEGAASFLKLFSGWFSDRVGRRKPLVVAGYGLSATGKLLLALSFVWPQVLLARLVDRVGKGVRTSPRDALIADSTSEGYSGRAFGFHRAMDTAGAVIGPLFALGLVALAGERLRLVFIIAAVPAFLSVLPFLRVREVLPPGGTGAPLFIPRHRVPRQFWFVLAITVLFALTNSSDAFIILRGRDLGMSLTAVVLAYVLYNTLYSLLAYPLGDLSDRLGKRPLLVLGFAVFGFVYLGFALIDGSAAMWPLFAAYGVYVAATEGVARSLVSDLAPPEERATLLGLYHALISGATVASSAIAGVLWDLVSPRTPFFLGAAGGIACAVLMLAPPLRTAPARGSAA
ncbi:MAG TPA: MFS transporter [Dehalococcoidia bacterium]|nr:MFS transporter [Dehalococcoidia bacterium]